MSHSQVRTDATSLVVPLWGVLTAGATILSAIVLTLVWVLTTYEAKSDTILRHTQLEQRVTTQESVLTQMSADVAYIRGRMEPKK